MKLLKVFYNIKNKIFEIFFLKNISNIILYFFSNNSKITFINFSFGCLTIIGDNKSYKVEIIKNSLSKELKNRALIKNKYHSINKLLLPILIEKKFGFRILISDTIPKLNNSLDIFKAYSNVLNQFNKHYIENKNISVKDFCMIKLAIEKISRNQKEYKELEYLFQNEINKQKKFRPSHGDFHLNNILKYNDFFYIIDLDCFREIQFIWMDEIYFVIELIYIENKDKYKSWRNICYKILLEEDDILYQYKEYFINFNYKQPFTQMLIFIFDRIGQDSLYGKCNFDFIHKIIDSTHSKVIK